MGKIKKKKDDYFTGGYTTPDTLEHMWIDEPMVYHTPMGSTTIPYPSFLPERDYTFDYADVIDSESKTVTISPAMLRSNTWSTGVYDWEKEYQRQREEHLKEEIGNVKIDEIKSSNPSEHIFACQNKEDLSIDNILTTLSAVKGRLMFDIAPVHVKEIICSVTPKVRDNILKASKKLKMYGKEMPIVACFDEYGKRLDDKIEIGAVSGITLKVIDPEEYGELYYELKAIEFPSVEYDTSDYLRSTIAPFEFDTPFYRPISL